MKVLRSVGYALAGLLALVALVLATSYFWPPSDLQKQARAVLEATQVRPGSNAWGDLETLLHEGIDAAQRRDLVDRQLKAVTAWSADWTAALKSGGALSDEDFPHVPVIGGDVTAWRSEVPPCAVDVPCLPVVREHRQALADAVQSRPGLYERIDALSQHGHLASPYPAISYSAIASLPVGNLPSSSRRHLLHHLDGQSAQTLDGLCRDMGTARMMAAEGDNLLLSQVGIRWLESNAQWMGEILAEWPGDDPLPGHCTAAMAPLPARALGQCTAFAGEYRASTAMIEASSVKMTDRPGGVLLFNPEKSRYRSASLMGQACTPAAGQQLDADQRWMHDASPLALWRMECPANAIGCVLTGIAGPAYDRYVNRAQDADARLRLLRAAVQLRGRAGESRPLAERLAALPPAASPRQIRLGADGRALEIEAYSRDRSEGQIRLPLLSPLSP